ncbi:MAG: hypothetical protein R3C05_14800 [Pirellulaceae bacterium]
MIIIDDTSKMQFVRGTIPQIFSCYPEQETFARLASKALAMRGVSTDLSVKSAVERKLTVPKKNDANAFRLIPFCLLTYTEMLTMWLLKRLDSPKTANRRPPNDFALGEVGGRGTLFIQYNDSIT